MTKRAIWIEEPTATEIERSILSLTDTETAVKCSAALPTYDISSRSIHREARWTYNWKQDQTDPFPGQLGMSLNKTIDTGNQPFGGDSNDSSIESHDDLKSALLFFQRSLVRATARTYNSSSDTHLR